jgi:hypothetical protein
MHRLLTTSIVCLGLSAGWGCGSTTSGPTGHDPGTSGIQDLVRALYDCAFLLPGRRSFHRPLANCESEYAAQSELLPFVEKGTVVIHSEPFAACVSAYRSAGSPCTGRQVAPACVNAFGGTIQEGGACEKSDECLDTEDPVVCLKVRPAGVTETPKTGVCKLAPRGRMARGPVAQPARPGKSLRFHLLDGQSNPVLTLCYEEDGLFCSSPVPSIVARRRRHGDPAPARWLRFPYCPQTSVCVARSSAPARARPRENAPPGSRV